MKKGLNAWTVNESYDFEQTFAAVAKAGFDGIELNVDMPGRSAHSLTLGTTKEEFAGIRELSKKHSLPVISISSSINGLSGNRALHGEYKKLLFKQIEAAKELGATGILTVPSGMSNTITMKEAYEASSDFYKSICKEVEAEGILVCLENVAAHRFLLSPYDFVSLVDQTGSPCFGSYFDAGNVLRVSEAEYWAEVLGNRIKFVHVKDYARTSVWEIERAPLGDGCGNWPGIIAELKKAGFDGYLTAEVPAKHGFESDDAYYADVARRVDRLIDLARTV